MGLDERRPWAYVYNDVIKNKELSGNDLKMYITLCMYANTEDNSCYPSHATLTKVTGFSKMTVLKCIEKLKTLGLIRVKERFSQDKQLSNMYKICEVPRTELNISQYKDYTDPVQNLYTNNNHITIIKDNNNKDINIVDYVNENTEEDADMQNRLLNIMTTEAKKERIFLAMATNDWSKVTATDYLKYLVGITGLWNGPEKRTILPTSGKDLNYIVGNFKKTFLEAYNLEGPRAIEAIANFVENYPHACDQKYRDRIDPIIFTMPGVVDRIMKYEIKLKPTKRDVSDEVF